MTRNRCALRRSSTTLLAPNRRVPSSTLKKEALLPGPAGPRISPGTQGKRTKGSHDALQEGRMPSRDGTAPVLAELQGFLPKKPYPYPRTIHSTGDYEDEASPPPDSPPTSKRHHRHETTIVVSPRQPSRDCRTEANGRKDRGQQYTSPLKVHPGPKGP